MLNRFLFIILFFSTQLFYLNTAYSDVYKWIDDNGKVVYGDKPESSNADKIKIKNAPEQDKNHQERYKKQQKLLDIMQEERDAKIALKKEEKEKKEKQLEKCAKARKELQEIYDASLLYEKTDDPYNPKIISDEERKAEEEKYEKYIKKYC
jgi:uncharacterized protein DUF4124